MFVMDLSVSAALAFAISFPFFELSSCAYRLVALRKMEMVGYACLRLCLRRALQLLAVILCFDPCETAGRKNLLGCQEHGPREYDRRAYRFQVGSEYFL
jgi:hypothetical protein